MPEATTKTRIAYFPGCSLASGARDYSESVLAVSRAAGIDLVEIPDWTCCGATAAHATNRRLGLALPARNLALASAEGFSTIMAPCAACYNRLQSVNAALRDNASTRAEIEDIIERKVGEGVRVINALEYAAEFLMPALAARVKPLAGLRLAPYYGCLLVRPPKHMAFDDAEDPQSMDNVIKSLGAEVADWEFKVECCGGGHSLSRTDIVLRLSSAILDAARSAGAHAIVTACPMCHSNLDMRQMDILAAARSCAPVPIYYLTQIIGLATGLSDTDLGIHRHFIPAGALRDRAAGKAGG
jgi:heterodisulfide reductase subunit B